MSLVQRIRKELRFRWTLPGLPGHRQAAAAIGPAAERGREKPDGRKKEVVILVKSSLWKWYRDHSFEILIVVCGIITVNGYINNDPYVRDIVHWAIIIGIPALVAFTLVFTPLLWIVVIFTSVIFVGDQLKKVLDKIHGLRK